MYQIPHYYAHIYYTVGHFSTFSEWRIITLKRGGRVRDDRDVRESYIRVSIRYYMVF